MSQVLSTIGSIGIVDTSVIETQSQNEITNIKSDTDTQTLESFKDAASNEQDLLKYKTEAISLATSALSLVTSDIQLVSDAFNDLSFDFYSSFMAKLNKNVVFSPVSIASLITMCYFSADEATKLDITNLLHFKQSSENSLDLKQTLIILFNLLNRIACNNVNRHVSIASITNKQSEYSYQSVINTDLRLEMNSSIYCRTNYLLDKYKTNLTEIFEADILLEDIEKDNLEKILNKINRKPRMLTKKNINEMMIQDNLNENVFMVIINTLQFESQWKLKITEKPQIGFFEVNEEKIIEISLLKIPEAKFMYVNKPKGLPCKVCEIPFMNESFVFTIILPESNCMDIIEGMLTNELFNDLINRMNPKRLSMLLPKFQIYDHLDYKKLFNKSQSVIDFSRIKTGLGINKSTYKSYIRLCEKGIEASCCSSVSLSHEDINLPNTYKEHPCEEFKCDKPFLFFIREKNTRIILFMGKLVLPD